MTCCLRILSIILRNKAFVVGHKIKYMLQPITPLSNHDQISLVSLLQGKPEAGGEDKLPLEEVLARKNLVSDELQRFVEVWDIMYEH